MVGVEDLPRRVDVGRVVGRRAPGQFEDRVEPGTEIAGLGALVVAALELADLAEGGLANVVGQRGLFDPRAVVLGAVGLVLAQLLADGVELLAEQELALVLFHPVADVGGDLVVDLHLGQVLLRPLDQDGQPLGDVRGLEQPTLLLVAQPRGVAGQVGQRAGVADLVDGVDDLPGVAALQGGDDQRLVFGGQLGDRLGDRLLRQLLGLDPQGRAGSRDTGADLHPPFGANHRGGLTGREPTDLDDRGQHTVRGVPVLQPRSDEERRVATGPSGVDGRAGGVVELDRHHHAGQDDEVVQEQNRKLSSRHQSPPG